MTWYQQVTPAVGSVVAIAVRRLDARVGAHVLVDEIYLGASLLECGLLDCEFLSAVELFAAERRARRERAAQVELVIEEEQGVTGGAHLAVVVEEVPRTRIVRD